MIRLTLKHKDKTICEKASMDIAMRLKKIYPEGILGPDVPVINRIQNLYLKNILIKIKKEDQPEYYKKLIRKEINAFLQEKDYKTIRISADVDPM
jgi:primosomal protein N' (replication factor Y)